jgi:hypothetical protein
VIFAPLAVVVPLVAAYDRGDLDEVARQADRLGAAGLAAELAGDRADAAIAAAPAAQDAYELLPDLARIADGWDRARAAPAARAAARIAGALDDAGERDLADDVLAAAQRDWAALATRADRWTDVRVHALEVAAHVARARHAGPGYDVTAALADPDPELRRAAAELVPAPVPEDLRAPLAHAIAIDADPIVALAAAQALCGDVASDPPAPILTALRGATTAPGGATPPSTGLARLRAIAAAPPDGAPAPALLDTARCLAADDDPASAAALRALAAKGPRSIRASVGKLTHR